MWVAVVLSLMVAGSDPADDPAPPTPSLPDLDDDDDTPPRAAVPPSPATTPRPTTAPTPTAPVTADPADPADVRPAAPVVAPTPTPTPGAPTGPIDPDDAVAPPPATPQRTLAPEAAPEAAPDERPAPEPRLPIATGGMVALGGCGAGAVPFVASVCPGCPGAYLLAPATSCCGTVGTAAAVSAQDGGNPLTAGAAAAGGIALAGALGGIATAGIVALYTGGSGCFGDGFCMFAMGATVVGGSIVGATFIGPILGGGAVTIVEHLRQDEAAMTPSSKDQPRPRPSTAPAAGGAAL